MYPTITAGQRITADLLRSMLPQVIVKPTMTERASTTTATIDPDLQFEGEAGATYVIEYNLIPAAVQAADFKTEWIVPSGASGLKNVLGPASNASTNSNADALTMRAGVHTLGTGVAYAGVRDANTLAFTVQEFGVVTLTGAGTVGIAWAQNTSSTTGSRLYNGSYMRVTRVS